MFLCIVGFLTKLPQEHFNPSLSLLVEQEKTLGGAREQVRSGIDSWLLGEWLG